MLILNTFQQMLPHQECRLGEAGNPTLKLQKLAEALARARAWAQARAWAWARVWAQAQAQARAWA